MSKTRPKHKRFMEKVKADQNGCWIWTAAIHKEKGYGQFRDGATMRQAHIVAYELFCGPVPSGLEIDHTCRVRHCVNPKHLEAVTHKVNLHRSEGFAAKYIVRTHCEKGHEFTPENTFMRDEPSGGSGRRCRQCERERSRKRKAKARNEKYRSARLI